MPLGTHRLSVSIVVELDEFRSPPNEHRVARGKNEPHRNPETLRPCSRGPERCLDQSNALVKAPSSPPPNKKSLTSSPILATPLGRLPSEPRAKVPSSAMAAKRSSDVRCWGSKGDLRARQIYVC